MSHDQQLRASCRSGPSHPPAELRWSLTYDDGPAVTREQVITSGLRTSLGSETVSSLTLAQAGDNHAGLSLTCEAIFDNDVVLTKTHHIKILGKELFSKINPF